MQKPFSNNDSELVALLIAGNAAAFESIYRKYGTDLLRYCYRKIGNKEDCEELIQDIFESLWLRRKDLQHVNALKSYLFSMVKYKVVDYIRHSLVKKKFEEHFLLYEAVFETVNDPTGNYLEIQELIDKSIAQLPARCQTAFRLRLQENLPYKEIAHAMNISIKTVEKHISAGLQHLRNACHNASYHPGL